MPESVLNIEAWLADFRAPSLRDLLGEFITSAEREGDILGAQGYQAALSDTRLKPALTKPFKARERPKDWPFVLAVMFLFEHSLEPQKQPLERKDNDYIKNQYAKIAKKARSLEQDLKDLERDLRNVEATPLDDIPLPEGMVSMRGGALTSALPMLALRAEAEAARGKYMGRMVPTAGTKNYPKYFLVADIDKKARNRFGQVLTPSATASVATVILDDISTAQLEHGDDISPVDVTNARKANVS